MLKRVFFVSLVALVVMFAGAAMAAIPPYISFQGRLTTGSPPTAVTTATSVTFGIYPVATGGSPSWEGTATITPDSDGIFNVILGLDTTTTVGDLNTLAFNIPLWVEVGVAGNTGTRQRLTTVPYAFRSKWTDNVPDPIVPADGIQDITGGLATNGIAVISPLTSSGLFAIGATCTGAADAIVGYNYGNGVGVKGQSQGTNAYAHGVYGYANGGPGVRGFSSKNHGVHGTSWGTGKAGVYGEGFSAYNNIAGVFGVGNSGVVGRTSNASDPAITNFGVAGKSVSGIGVYGGSTSSIGLYGNSGSTTSAGVYAENSNATTPGPALELGSGWIKMPTAVGTVESLTPITVNAIAGKIINKTNLSTFFTINNKYVKKSSIILATQAISSSTLTVFATAVNIVSDGSFQVYIGSGWPETRAVNFMVINQ